MRWRNYPRARRRGTGNAPCMTCCMTCMYRGGPYAITTKTKDHFDFRRSCSMLYSQTCLLLQSIQELVMPHTAVKVPSKNMIVTRTSAYVCNGSGSSCSFACGGPRGRVVSGRLFCSACSHVCSECRAALPCACAAGASQRSSVAFWLSSTSGVSGG